VNVVGDLSSVLARLGHVSLPLLAAGLVFQGLGLGLRGLAWRNILRAGYPDRPVPAGPVIGAYVTGVAANGILPAKGGEVAKVALARRAISGSSTPMIVAALGVLSLFDAVVGAAIILTLIATGTVPGINPTHLIALNPRIAAVVAAVVLALGVAVTLSSRLHRRLRAAAGQALGSLAVLRTPGRYLRSVAALQAAAWACRLGVAATLLDAFGLRPTLATAATVVVLGGLAGLVPGSPGGLGSQQLVLAYALGATAATASIVVFSVGMQLAIAGFQIMLGIAALMLMLRVAHPLRAMRELRTLARSDAAA
jgi:glycosyltransferase 2 family protein